MAVTQGRRTPTPEEALDDLTDGLRCLERGLATRVETCLPRLASSPAGAAVVAGLAAIVVGAWVAARTRSKADGPGAQSEASQCGSCSDKEKLKQTLTDLLSAVISRGLRTLHEAGCRVLPDDDPAEGTPGKQHSAR